MWEHLFKTNIAIAMPTLKHAKSVLLRLNSPCEGAIIGPTVPKTAQTVRKWDNEPKSPLQHDNRSDWRVGLKPAETAQCP